MPFQSQTFFKKAKRFIPGGVNSPVRAFGAVGGIPVFAARAKGPYLWDVDGKRYLDLVSSWGPMILGHSHAAVTMALSKQARRGTSYGIPTKNEVVLAKLIHDAFPSVEKVRLTSSGTEAAMSAVRLARGFTNRKKILKCDGCYHGHGDSLLVRAGSGGATFGIPNSAGIPDAFAKLTVSIPYNDLGALKRVLRREGSQIAVFIIEPVPANMGVVLPKPGYLETVRKLTKKYGVLLLFDEVITGFRLAFGGAGEYFGVKPDITCLGKILGGGLPIGAFGGRRDVMKALAPEGPVYQAGTLSGNPLATAAGIETLRLLKQKNFYRKLNAKSLEFYDRLDKWIDRKNAPVTLNRIGSLFTIFFTSNRVTDFASAKTSNAKHYGKFFHHLLRLGVYTPPSQFEANFISQAMTLRHFRFSARAICRALSTIF